MLRILLIAALLPVVPAHADEPMITKPTTQLAKPATKAAAPAAPAATHYWYDGDRRRELRVDEGLRADFSGGQAVLVERDARAGKALGATSDADADDGAVVFHDAGSPAVKRALPGGVIITTHGPTDARALDRLLAPRGLAVSRPLDASGTRWLVETPGGVAGLELANRLHERGDFAAVAPNWWRERALK